MQEVLSEILLRLQGSSQAEDTCIVKAASDLIVSLLLGGKKKKKGILMVQIHKETTSKSPLSRGLVICFCCFHFLNRDTSATCLIILRGILLRHHTFTFYRSLMLILPCFPSSIYIRCLKSFNTTVTAPAQNRNTSTRTSGHCTCTCGCQFTPSLLSKLA